MSTQVRERVSKVEIRRPRVSARRFHFSAVEITAAVVVVLFFFGAVFYYFQSLKPEQDNLSRLEAELDRQKQVLIDIAKGGAPPSGKQGVQAALDSLDVFKTERLKPRAKGQRALIDEINALVKKHGAQLTSGLEMSLENTGQETEKKKSTARNAEASLNVFPKLNINFTVEGQYKNLRAFIGELENNKQFLVIRSINISAVEQSDETGRRSASVTSGLSLSVNLSAYFQP